MKVWIKNNIFSIIALLTGVFSFVFSTVKDTLYHRDQELETIRCLRKIVREETDVNKKYFKEHGYEIRHTNNFAGNYWFDEKRIVEVDYEKSLDLFYIMKGDSKRYLK